MTPPHAAALPPVGTQTRRAHLWRRGGLFAAATVLGAAMVACSGGGSDGSGTASPAPTATQTVPSTESIPSTAGPLSPPAKATVLNSRLNRPWALAFLPDGRMLVTQIGGSMVILSADGTTISGSIAGVPSVVVDAQGGLLDVALDPDFDLATNPWIYWTYSEANGGGSATAVAKGQLILGGTVAEGVSPGSLANVQVIYRQTPASSNGGQYGSRLVFRKDKTLFVTLGDRQEDSTTTPNSAWTQNPATTLGKVIRINRDGTPAAGNPFASTASTKPEIWSLGHRNPQGAAINPVDDDLWVTEHGPQGGDEVNHVRAGANYGWPLRSYGCPYGASPGLACQIGGGTHAPDFTEPVATWVPFSIAPSGMMFYTGSGFPEWKDGLLMGAMQTNTGYAGIQRGLWHLAFRGDTVTVREHLDLVDDRVRDVRQGPDGWIYLLTDSGQLIRIDR